MASWVCRVDEVRYSVGAPCCPQCGTDDPYEEGDPTMAKISKAGGPTNVDDPNLPPHLDEDGEQAEVDSVPADARDEQAGGDGGEQADEVFDPGQHTTSQVNEYLAGARAAERQRVLDAERVGRNRSGIRG